MGFIAGLAAVLLAAGVWPLPVHVRYRSLISVPPDGGRQEAFVIHWPDDRIAPPAVAVLEDSSGRRASAEVFRLRDTEDNVIGVGSRLAGTGGSLADPGRSASNWLLVIPSRGALFLAQSDQVDMTAREQATANGLAALPPAQGAAFWAARSTFRVTATAPAGNGSATTGKVLRGTNEFAGLRGSFTETWDLDEALADGSTRGRITLSTVTAGGN